MECIEARALKSSSLLSEIAMISTQKQVCFDDVRGYPLGSVTCGDDIWVDELFDFSDDKGLEDDGDGSTSSQEESSEEDEASKHLSSSQQRSSFFKYSDEFTNNSHQPNNTNLGPGELALPVEDEMENLEWLSQIVDDSGTEISLLCPVGRSSSLEKQREPVVVQIVRESCFPSPVCRKPRGKRERPKGRGFWTLGWPPPVTTTESSSTTSLSSYGSSTVLGFAEAEPFSSVEKPVPKKQKKRPAGESGSQGLRRCSHCQVQKTPQWRAGPMGPKTLCNACGVRYKSGRLFPEYRPACSPTFSREIHSNSHRKVLEMRRMKEGDGPDGPIGSVPAETLPSF